MRKVLSFILSVVLTLTIFPSIALAKEEGSSSDSQAAKAAQEILRQNLDTDRDPFGYLTNSEQDVIVSAQDSSPESYDLRNVDGKNYVTPVKFQNPFGTCWGFASIAAAETSLLGSGLADQDGYAAVADGEKKELDLSEKHLVYFVRRPISDPDSPQYGEGLTDDGTMTTQDRMNLGGMMTYAASMFSQGVGVNLEDRIDPNNNNESMKDILSYKGKQGNVEMRIIGGKRVNFCYDEEDDWSLPDNYRFYQSYVLKEAYELPTPAAKEDGHYKYDARATLAIKEQLLQKRGVAIGFHADTYVPGQDAGEGTYINENWAHFTYTYGERPNHGVTIIGYDDNYPSENFQHRINGMNDEEAYKLTTPEGNGAWLVKNSWGSGEEEFPNKGPATWGLLNGQDQGVYNDETKQYEYKAVDGAMHTGYFWLSYYDRSLNMIESFEFDKSNVGTKYNLDQHDYMPVNDVFTLESSEEQKMANVFKADESQSVDQVTCVTTHPGTTVKSEVYLLSDSFDDPEDGILIGTTQEETFSLGGFHKMNVEGVSGLPIVQKGQYYSVVQTHTLSDGTYESVIPQAYAEKIYKEIFGGLVNNWSKGVVNAKESYWKGSEGWSDYREIIDYLDSGESEGYYTYDNFPIKAYCTPKQDLTLKISSNVNLYSRGQGTSETLRLRFRGSADAELDNADISWVLADDGDEIVSLEPDSNDVSRAKVTAKKAGQTRLMVSVDGVGTSIVNVKVVDPYIAVVFNQDPDHVYVYNGQPQEIDPFNLLIYDCWFGFPDENNISCTYKNNVKCGEATFTVEPKGDFYTGDPQTLTFNIVPQKAVISELTAKAGSLDVTVNDQKESGVSSYELQYRVAGTSQWLSKTFPSDNNKFTLSGLTEGSQYEVRVRAYAEKAGYGEMSEVSKSAKIEGSPTQSDNGDKNNADKNNDGKPSQSVIKKLTPGKKKLTVTVKSQKKEGVTKYHVQYRVKGKKKWLSKKFSADSSKLVLKNLKKGKRYNVRIRAFKKNVGYGKWSKVKTTKKIK